MLPCSHVSRDYCAVPIILQLPLIFEFCTLIFVQNNFVVGMFTGSVTISFHENCTVVLSFDLALF